MPVQFTAPLRANVKLAEDQPEYTTIPVRRDLIEYDFQDGAGPVPVRRMVIALNLTPNDLRRMLADPELRLNISVLGQRFAPMLVTVGDPDAEQPPINLTEAH